MSGHKDRSSGGKKKGGGFLARQAKAKGDRKPITEEELLCKDKISPDDILALRGVSESKSIFLFP